jgi:hypothetical protein
MKTSNNRTEEAGDRLLRLEQALQDATAALAPPAEIAFTKAYEMIESAIANGVPIKVIIEKVNDAFDLRLHPASFRDLLNNERLKRGTKSEHRCKRCKQVIATKPTQDSEPSPNKTQPNEEVGNQVTHEQAAEVRA